MCVFFFCFVFLLFFLNEGDFKYKSNLIIILNLFYLKQADGQVS